MEMTPNPYIIRSLYACPGEQPEAQYLNGTESQMEDLVHGRIASIGVDDGICVIHNAFSEALKMPENRTIYNQTFYGPMIVAAFDSFGNILSLSDEDFEYYREMLSL